MKAATPVWALLGLFAGLLVSACVSKLEVKECMADGDCSSGQTCIEQRCTDGSQTGCSADGDCASALTAASPMPAGCAEARCVSGSCALRAKDQDGDGDRAARCTGSAPITVGTDCDDRPGAGATINPKAAEVCANDGVDENCNGTVNEGCGCPVEGAQTACCGGRGTQRCVAVDGGGNALTTCSATVSAEACNGVDDDCNGQVDDAVVLDPDGGTVALDGGVVRPDGTCAVGVGVCARQGTFTCAGGALGCGASPGDAGAETCNGLDDNCNGTVDEGLAQDCFADDDNDRYHTTADVVPQCPVTNRPAFGNCPPGFVAPAASLGKDCAPTDASAFRFASLRADRDEDARCVGAVTQACIGATVPTGQRLDVDCRGDDCDDGDKTLYQTLVVRTDGDEDGYCVGLAADRCSGVGPPRGSRLATDCAASDDCKDTNPLANRFCSIVRFYQTNVVTKQCLLFSPPFEDFSVGPVQSCPNGFSPTNVRGEEVGGPGSCRALAINRVRADCLGSTAAPQQCRVVADCAAD